MSDISKLPAHQVDQSHDALAGLAREVLRRYENAKDWRQPPDDWENANRTRIYMRKACEVAPALARAVLEQHAEIAMLKDIINTTNGVDVTNMQAEIERLREYERMFNNYLEVEKQLRGDLTQAAEREKRLREEIKKLLRLAELDYQRAFDGLSSGQYIIALDSVLGIAESAKTVAQRALASEQP